MPIFVYEPIPQDPDSSESAAKECCYFETLQWSTEAPLTQCPECGGPIRRAVTSFAFSAQVQSDPLKGIAKKLGDGIDAGQKDAASAGATGSKPLISDSSSNSAAGRAARLAYRHVCSGNCRH